jgi:hypothetical protein
MRAVVESCGRSGVGGMAAVIAKNRAYVTSWG